jgi:HPt (histidine-containing phosphotransfer) domain-containing protein
LPHRLAQLDESLRTAGGERPSGEELEAARNLAHALKGTSGSYGFDEVGAELARIEKELDRLLEGGALDSDAIWGEIEGALQRARLASPDS